MSTATETAKPAVDMVTIEVDGISMQVPKNSMIIEATDRAGIEIPRFCYHRKLSIAANCRMCLVDVEKAPKPMPACATPVMEGMKVYTTSRRAIDAQHGVMEFLLINHPLDCPICDQGGECELQDLAMGYGRSVSRFSERKRVVKDKDVGPLVQTDMTRCIHCTRCVRFLEEVAGTCEMGGVGRGDRLEITSSIEGSIDSELSGNIIDLCPVGALTNKPFRFSARAWELTAHPSRAVHDGLASALHYHCRRGDVMRAVPREDEASNETWLSDRDRYSHFGLYAEDRLLQPRIKRDGQWRDASWDEAIAAAAGLLQSVPGGDLGVLMSPSASNEAYFLARRLAEGLDCPNIDHRLREQDFSDDGARPALLGANPAQVQAAGAVLLVGSNLRHEAPVLGHRVRQAWRKGARVLAINPLQWDFHFTVSTGVIAPPQEMVAELASLAAAVAKLTNSKLPAQLAPALDAAVGAAVHEEMAQALVDAREPVVIVGQAAMAHPQAAWLRALSAWLATAVEGRLNLLPHGGNTAGACAHGALPGPRGLNARSMLESPRRALLLWDFEPAHDTHNPALACQAIAAAEAVVAVSSFADQALLELADVLLPLAPWAESEGSLTSLDGRQFTLAPAGRSSGEARPGWKILRRLGQALGLEGFEQVSLAGVQAEMAGAGPAAGLGTATPQLPRVHAAKGLHRIGAVPMYSEDALCRRATPLQNTVHATGGFLGLNPEDAAQLGLSEGVLARVAQGEASAELAVRVDARVPVGGAWIPSGTCATRTLGDAMGAVSVAASGRGS